MSTRLVDVRAGSVYLPAALVDTYFRGVEAVVLLIRGGALHVLPVTRMEQGGCLLKQRNAAGDRVASAPDVFHAHGLQDWDAAAVATHWSASDAALVVPLPVDIVCKIETT